jgi:hypothetical protein
MEGDKLLSKMHDHLFASKSTQLNVFSDVELKVVSRFRAAVTKWYDDPWMTEMDIRNFLMNEYQISESQAYRDIPKIKYLFGNVNFTSKEFYRMRANKLIEEARQEIDDAESNLEVNKALAKIKAAMAYGKNNKLDKEDKFMPLWDDIQIPDYSPTSDVSVIEGLKPIPNLEEKKRLLRIELGLAQEIIDVPFEEMKDGKTTDLSE